MNSLLTAWGYMGETLPLEIKYEGLASVHPEDGTKSRENVNH